MHRNRSLALKRFVILTLIPNLLLPANPRSYFNVAEASSIQEVFSRLGKFVLGDGKVDEGDTSDNETPVEGPRVGDDDTVGDLLDGESDLAQPEGQDPFFEMKMIVQKLDGGPRPKLKLKKGLFARVLTYPKRHELRSFLLGLLNRVLSEGDLTKIGGREKVESFQIFISSSPFPNAYINLEGRTMGLSLGLLGMIQDVGALAGVMLHELGHSNKDLLEELAKSTEITKLTSKFPDLAKMPKKQAEEFLCDYYAVKRLTELGFNPWSMYQFFSELANLTDYQTRRRHPIDAFGSTHHPLPLRTQIVKFQLEGRHWSGQFQEQFSSKQPIPENLKGMLGAISQWSKVVLSIDRFVGLKKLFYGSFFVAYVACMVLAINSSAYLAANAPGLIVPVIGAGAAVGGIGFLFSRIRPTGRDSSLVAERIAELNRLFNTRPSDSSSIGRLIWQTSQLKLLVALMIIIRTSQTDITSKLKYLERCERKLRWLLNQIESSLGKNVVVPGEILIEIVEQIVFLRAQVSNSEISEKCIAAALVGVAKKGKNFNYAEIVDENIRREMKFLGDIVDPLVETLEARRPDPQEVLSRLYLYEQQQNEARLKFFTDKSVIVKAQILINNRSFHLQLEELLLSDKADLSASQLSSITRLYAVFSVSPFGRAIESFISMIDSLRINRLSLIPALKLISFIDSFSAAVTLIKARDRREDLAERLKEVRAFVLQRVWKILEADGVSTFGALSRYLSDELPSQLQFVLRGRIFFDILTMKLDALITNPNDVDLLIADEKFWPKFDAELSLHGVPTHIKEEIKRLQTAVPLMWAYDPDCSDRLHRRIMQVLSNHSRLPGDVPGKLKLLMKLTSLGVTVTTDDFALELKEQVSNDEAGRIALAQVAKEGRIWLPPLRFELIRALINGSKSYQLLLSENFRWENERKYTLDFGKEVLKEINLELGMAQARRLGMGQPRIDDSLAVTDFKQMRRLLINVVLDRFLDLFPSGGQTFQETLEDFSWLIESDAVEARAIEAAKSIKIDVDGANLDLGLRSLSAIFQEVSTTEPEQQWNLILFLREESELSQSNLERVAGLGATRFRRAFFALPIRYRIHFLDALLDSPASLLRSKKPVTSAAKRELKQPAGVNSWQNLVLEYLFGDIQEPGVKSVVLDLFEAFLFALEKTGGGALKSMLLSTFLAHEGKANSYAHTLKLLGETLGGSYLKTLQALVASGLFEGEALEILRDVEDKTGSDTRASIYDMLREEAKGRDGPIQIQNWRRGGSMKSVIKATDPETHLLFVIVALQSGIRTRLKRETVELQAIVEFLISKSRRKYGALAGIVRSGIKNANREVNLDQEVKNAEAMKRVYDREGDRRTGFTYRVPELALITPNTMASSFAPGINPRDLPPAERRAVIPEVGELESRILRQHRSSVRDGSEVVRYDPDRHPGNTLVWIEQDDRGQPVVVVSHIDFGLASEITVAQIRFVEEFFALSEIFQNFMPTRKGTQILLQIMERAGITGANDISNSEFEKIMNVLKSYLPTESSSKDFAYFALLSATEEGLGVELPSYFYDYPRAIFYNRQHWRLPIALADGSYDSDTFEPNVREIAEQFLSEITSSLTSGEKAGWFRQKCLTYFKRWDPERRKTRAFGGG